MTEFDISSNLTDNIPSSAMRCPGESGAVPPSVSCIVLNWNGWRDTIVCIASLEKADYPNLSIIVVDNGSTDDSVQRIHSEFPLLEIIESPANLGFGSGNNLGIRVALQRGVKYIWLLNNDTVVEPVTLTALVSHAESDPELGEIGSVLCYAHAPDQVQAWGGGRINLWTGTSRHYTEPVTTDKLDFLTAASVLIPAAVLEKVGLFDEQYFMYWEDTDLSFRIRAAGWKLGVATDAKLLHKEGTSTGPKSPLFDRYVTVSGIRFLRKYAPLPIVSIFMLTFARALKRFLRGDWKRGCAVLAGMSEIGAKPIK
jgi:GT2 family glycosyltransferase